MKTIFKFKTTAICLAGFAVSIFLAATSPANASPDGDTLCERNVVLSKYFTPGWANRDTQNMTGYEFTPNYCSRDFHFYHAEKPFLAQPTVTTIQAEYRTAQDINAASILGIKLENYVHQPTDCPFVVSLDTDKMATAFENTRLYWTANVGEISNADMAREVVTVLNKHLDGLIMSGNDKLYKSPPHQDNLGKDDFRSCVMQVNADTGTLRKLGFTPEIMQRLNGSFRPK